MASAPLQCEFARSPPLNTDIAGIGVRISTYVQSLLTVIIITVSPELGDIYAQCFPFVIMNISVLIAALALGFAPNPEITLQDGLIAWLFTFIPLFVFALGTGMIRTRNKLKAVKSSVWDRLQMEWSSHIMLVLHAGYTLSLLRNYANFGKSPECNDAARIFFFGTHSVTNAWFIGWTIAYAISLALMYSILMKAIVPIFSQRRIPSHQEEKKETSETSTGKKEKESTEPESGVLGDYLWGILTFVILVIWIAFTEVTVVKNDFAPSDSPAWQFGQIFPMILLTVPVLATARSVSEFIQRAGGKKKKTAKDEEYAMSGLPAKKIADNESNGVGEKPKGLNELVEKGPTDVVEKRSVEVVEKASTGKIPPTALEPIEVS